MKNTRLWSKVIDLLFDSLGEAHPGKRENDHTKDDQGYYFGIEDIKRCTFHDDSTDYLHKIAKGIYIGKILD